MYISLFITTPQILNQLWNEMERENERMRGREMVILANRINCLLFSHQSIMTQFPPSALKWIMVHHDNKTYIILLRRVYCNKEFK